MTKTNKPEGPEACSNFWSSAFLVNLAYPSLVGIFIIIVLLVIAYTKGIKSTLFIVGCTLSGLVSFIMCILLSKNRFKKVAASCRTKSLLNDVLPQLKEKQIIIDKLIEENKRLKDEHQ